MTNSHLKRWQFTMSQMLVIVALLCVAVIWQFPKLERHWVKKRAARQRAEAISKLEQLETEIQKVGGRINTSRHDGSVVSVNFFHPNLQNITYEYFQEIEQSINSIQKLGWPDSDANEWYFVLIDGVGRVTDNQLTSVQGLSRLRELNLENSRVTDFGLQHLAGLRNLKYLKISGTQITDEGLRHLKALTRLESLYLTKTQITDEGLRQLESLKNLKKLALNRTKVTDSGLIHLHSLPRLRKLILPSQITDEGVKDLWAVLPNCRVWRYDNHRGTEIPQPGN